MSLLNNLQALVKANEHKAVKKKTKRNRVDEAYIAICTDLEEIAKQGMTYLNYYPETIPDEVDGMLRDEGLIVWRNSETFKVQIPKD